MRDVRNHIIRQYQLDEFGRAIELSMPEIAVKEVQTEPEFAEQEPSATAKQDESSLQKNTT